MVKKQEFIWNGIASVVASLLSAILLLIITRINGSDMAGMFAITFASATILNAIGDFGMRVFQVTDTKREYAFSDYLNARIVVAFVMIMVSIIFVCASGYILEKAILCLLFVLYRFVESISETYQGELQLNKRLDLAAKSVVLRSGGAIIAFFLVDLLFENIFISIVAMIIWGVVISIFYDHRYVKKYHKIKYYFDRCKVQKLVLICFPTFFSTLLNLYLINAPKYAIDSTMTYVDQTIFNIIFLPTFTINLLSIFILKPILLTLGVKWNKQKYHDFISIIFKMGLLIIAVTVFVELVCYFMGIEILTLIYGIDLLAYKWDLLILVVSGGLSAFSVMLFYALTTMRCQKLVAIPYIISSIVALVSCNILVAESGIHGAAISSVLITFTLFITSLIILLWQLNKITRKMSKNLHLSENTL